MHVFGVREVCLDRKSKLQCTLCALDFTFGGLLPWAAATTLLVEGVRRRGRPQQSRPSWPRRPAVIGSRHEGRFTVPRALGATRRTFAAT